MPIIGIDLGTSTSEIAFLNEAGETKLIPNHVGEVITPSVVHIEENGNVLVGLGAKEFLLLEPENTFMEIKRLMGSSTKLTARGKSYTPKELSSHILKYLAECAEKHLKEPVTDVVITVPAYFTDLQRRETIEAGEMAGLNVMRIINEPTAASLDYGLNNMELCQNIMVYDFGGGTLDVTIMELFEGAVDVKSSCGNNALGGKDFDQLIIDYVLEKIKKNKSNITSDLRAMMRIKKEAELCKIELSSKEEYLIELPFLYKNGSKMVSFSETITRELFEGFIRDKVYSTKELIDRALYDAELTIKDIDLVLFVGGTTRIPLIQNFFKKEYKITPKLVIDPDLAVVKGAAIQAGIIMGTLEELGKDIVFVDVCPYSLSTAALKANEWGETDILCDILIPRNTTIPSTVQKVYYTSFDGQKEVQVTAYQGESIYLEENTLLNRFLLSGIPSAKAGKEQIKITFSYDLNGILLVEAEILSNGKKANVQIDTSKIFELEDLSGWDKAKKAKGYKIIIKKAEKYIENVENFEDFEDDMFEKEFDIEEMTYLVKELKKGILLEWDDEILNNLKERITEMLYELE